jgi:hypothetical protein
VPVTGQLTVSRVYLAKHPLGRGGERHYRRDFAVLGSVTTRAPSTPGEGAAYPQHTSVQIDIGPAQRESLPTPQPSVDQEREQGRVSACLGSTSGGRLQLAIAPAGAGKTTAMRALVQAWRDSGGQVVGLAPSAAAAAQLRDHTGAPAETLAKLTWSIHHGELPDWADRID